jgi:hypothetical protein
MVKGVVSLKKKMLAIGLTASMVFGIGFTGTQAEESGQEAVIPGAHSVSEKYYDPC